MNTVKRRGANKISFDGLIFNVWYIYVMGSRQAVFSSYLTTVIAKNMMSHDF